MKVIKNIILLIPVIWLLIFFFTPIDRHNVIAWFKGLNVFYDDIEITHTPKLPWRRLRTFNHGCTRYAQYSTINEALAVNNKDLWITFSVYHKRKLPRWHRMTCKIQMEES